MENTIDHTVRSRHERIGHLLREAEEHREDILSSRFFSDLRTGKLNKRRWLWQLLHWSGMFTRALSARSGMRSEDRFSDVFAEHATEEGRHPAQLKNFMRKSGFGPVGEGWALDHPPTPETKDLAHQIQRIALTTDLPLEQVMVLNALGEGAALDFYQAVLTHFGSEQLRGPYFHVHADVDDRHRLLGVDLLEQPAWLEYEVCRRSLKRAAEGFREMLNSWAEYESSRPEDEPGWSVSGATSKSE